METVEYIIFYYTKDSIMATTGQDMTLDRPKASLLNLEARIVKAKVEEAPSPIRMRDVDV